MSEVIVNPLGNFPLNDDWTYGKTVLDYFLHSRYHIGTSSSTLWAHFVWGLLFTKIFGFSFLILRISTLISSVVGLYFFFKLILKITKNESVALFAGLILLFNPIYFNLSNTYMTDVNFNTLFICCVYLAYSFFTTKKPIYFILFFLLALALVMVRQFGVIVPLSFAFSCLFFNSRRWQYVVAGITLTAAIFLVFKSYENFLQTSNSADAGYPFSGKVATSLAALWDKIAVAFKTRILLIMLYVVFFSSPFLAIYIFPLVKQINRWLFILVLMVSGMAGFLIFEDVNFPLGNIFANMQVGAETFYENLNPLVRDPQGHTYNETFSEIVHWLKVLAAGLFIAIIVLMLIFLITKRKRITINPLAVSFSAILVSYVFLLLVSDMYFDRYHLPLITLVLFGFSGFSSQLDAKPRLAWFIIIPLFYVSVFGTKDYFTLNTKRWEAYNYLRFNKKVANKKINAGYEVNLWNDGKYIVPYEPIFVESHDYLIQYRQEPGFKPLREYEFQRYFPYKKDKIYIFVREDKK